MNASKTCRTIDGCREGKFQARKSYCKEWFLQPAELISPWIHEGCKSRFLGGGQGTSSDSTLMLAISNRWSLNAWSLHLSTGSCCQAHIYIFVYVLCVALPVGRGFNYTPSYAHVLYYVQVCLPLKPILKHMHLLTRVYGKYAALRGLFAPSVLMWHLRIDCTLNYVMHSLVCIV